MEQTLGKRIVANRKRLGLTQDRLAELLGVTAQAVSKWENDQSCPDITMLPKLAEIFGISTDELLGLEKKRVYQAEVVTEADEDDPEDIPVGGRGIELQWEAGRAGRIGFAVWVLLVGGLLLASHYYGWSADLIDLLWSSGLMLFGLTGLYPNFSVFRLGCALFGGYFLYSEIASSALNTRYLLPVFLLLFGLSLLVDALKSPKNGSFHFRRSGRKVSRDSFSCEGETFSCSTSFNESQRDILLPRLSGGSVDVSFGQLSVDISGCEEIAQNCSLDLNCSFGELDLLVPRKYRVDADSSTAFGSVDIRGTPDSSPAAVLHADCNASFGQITIRYI